MEAASHLELSGVVYPACDPGALPAGATNAAQLAAAAQQPGAALPPGVTPAQIAAYRSQYGGAAAAPPPVAAAASNYLAQAAAAGGSNTWSGAGGGTPGSWLAQQSPAANTGPAWSPVSFGRKILGARAAPHACAVLLIALKQH